MKKNLDVLLSNKNVVHINGCLIWKRCLNTDGYPRASIDGNVNTKVHRIVYELSHPEEDISKKVIRHICDNPQCVMPKHLLSGTTSDNMRDRDERERHGNSKITHSEVRAIRDLARTKRYTQKELAEMFDLNHRTVSSIINYKHFKHVI